MKKLWSDYAEVIINRVTPSIKAKYNINITDLISNPSKFMNTDSISNTIENIKEDISKSTDQIINSYGAAKSKLEDEMDKAASISDKIKQHINLYAKQNNIPVIKPLFFEVDEQQKETVYIDNSEDSTLKFIEQLISISNVIFLSTIEYNNHIVGEWLFSTPTKNYVLRINIPTNPVYEIESARTEILDYLDSTKEYVGEEK